MSSSAEYRLLVNDTYEPEQVFTNFFENYDMESAIFQIREAKKIVVQKKYRFRPYSIEEDNTRFFFEKLEMMVEAAWLKKE